MSGFVSRITMRSGSQLPTIAFGTGSSYKGRANTVAEGVINAWKAGFR